MCKGMAWPLDKAVQECQASHLPLPFGHEGVSLAPHPSPCLPLQPTPTPLSSELLRPHWRFPLHERTIQPALLSAPRQASLYIQAVMLQCNQIQGEASERSLWLVKERTSVNSPALGSGMSPGLEAGVELEFQLGHSLATCPQASHFPSESPEPFTIPVWYYYLLCLGFLSH